MNTDNSAARILRMNKVSLLGTTSLVLSLLAAEANAQCVGGGAQSQSVVAQLSPNSASAPRLPNNSTLILPIDPAGTSSSIGSTVQSLVSIINTNNTAFLSQTSAFVGAPSSATQGLNGGGVWARGVGGTFDTNTRGSFAYGNSQSSGSGGCSIRNYQDFSGLQVGTDISRLNIDGGNAHFGVMMGYTETSSLSPTGGAGRLNGNFQTPFFGLYGAYTKDNFYADGQLRFDFLQGRLNDPLNNGLFNQTIDGRSFSLSGNVGKQFSFEENWFVEPSLGIVYSRASIDNFNLAGSYVFQTGLSAPSSVKIANFDSVLGRASVRFGRTYVIDGNVVQPFVTASVYNEFAGNIRTSVVSGFDPVGQVFLQTVPGNLSSLDTRIRINTSRIGTYGQISGGIAAQLGNTGWLSYVRGDYRFGDHVDGWGISGGLRYQFTPEQVAGRPIISKGYDAPTEILNTAEPVRWTGISVGGSVGGIIDVARQVPEFDRVSLFQRLPVQPRAAGILAGGQLGADYQIGNFVVGVAGDFDWTNASGGRNCKTPVGYFFSCNTSVQSVYMATGRVGYAIDRTLFYVKGGYAWADLTETYRDNTVGRPLITQYTSGANSEAQYAPVRNSSSGLTIGAGFEYALNKSWSAKAEYMHYQLDARVATFRPSFGFGDIPVPVKHTGDLVKVGVNYRFGQGDVFEVPAVAPIIRKY